MCCVSQANGHLSSHASGTPGILRKERPLSTHVVELPIPGAASRENGSPMGAVALRVVRAAGLALLPPAVALGALLIHWYVPNKQTALPTRAYPRLLEILLAA